MARKRFKPENPAAPIETEVTALVEVKEVKTVQTKTIKVRVDNPYLIIRNGPGTNYEKVGYAGTGDFELLNVTDGQGSKAGWGKLAGRHGWIAMDYVTKIAE